MDPRFSSCPQGGDAHCTYDVVPCVSRRPLLERRSLAPGGQGRREITPAPAPAPVPVPDESKRLDGTSPWSFGREELPLFCSRLHSLRALYVQ